MSDTRRVLVAMSGGVDSSVAAARVLEAGYTCIGATMRLMDAPCGSADGADGARDAAEANLRDIEDARAVCARLGIPHHVIDARAAFDRDVVEPFVRAYERGVTPNPCAVCNRKIKFGLLLEEARRLGCDAIATGHYARVVRRETPAGAVFDLKKARDAAKDQSYFLYGLTQEVLAHALFPLGGLRKDPEVRALAEQLGFANARKRDSQGICFVPDDDYARFIEQRRGQPLAAGDILDEHGSVIGRHRGAIRYTVGQRRGLGVAAAEPLYVTAIDAVANTVTLGPAGALDAHGLETADWIWSQPAAELECALAEAADAGGLAAGVKIRYRQNDQAARLMPLAAGGMRIAFETPQRGIAPGQAVVAYRGDTVLGGGTVARALA